MNTAATLHASVVTAEAPSHSGVGGSATTAEQLVPIPTPALGWETGSLGPPSYSAKR